MSWPVKPLGEIADTALGKMLDKGRDSGKPRVQYLRNVNVQWGRIDADDLLSMELADTERERFEVLEGDLLVCEGGEIGRCAIWRGRPEYIAFQKALHRIRTSEVLNAHFLRYLLEHQSNNGTLAALATGSTIPHLPQRQLRRIPVPLPSSDEQYRIVDILEDHLSRLDAAADYVRAAERRLDMFVTATLMNLIPNVDDYPAKWERSCVGDAGVVELGRQRHPDWHSGPNMKPYLRVANVFEDRIDTRDVMEMHWPAETFDRFKLRVGDVLLNEGQTPDLLGRPALYRGEPAEVAFTNSLLRFVASDRVLPEFALLVFRRHMRAGRFKRESRITTNIAHLSASRLKPIEFPIPDLAEQAAIVASAQRSFEAVERQRVQLAIAKSRREQLRKAILSAAFSGRLTGSSTELRELETV